MILLGTFFFFFLKAFKTRAGICFYKGHHELHTCVWGYQSLAKHNFSPWGMWPRELTEGQAGNGLSVMPLLSLQSRRSWEVEWCSPQLWVLWLNIQRKYRSYQNSQRHLLGRKTFGLGTYLFQFQQFLGENQQVMGTIQGLLYAKVQLCRLHVLRDTATQRQHSVFQEYQ